MTPFPIPVRPAPRVGPGSQPDDELGLDVMAMPRGMNTFEMPHVPEQVDRATLAAAAEWLAGFVGAMAHVPPGAGAAPARLELAGLVPTVLQVINEVLGEGEVSIRVRGETELRIQETVFAGVWRCCELGADGSSGRLVRDWLEAGALPREVVDAARAAGTDALAPARAPGDVMNAAALLAELTASLQDLRAGPAPPIGVALKQINLTLLPLSPGDRQLLEAALPNGPVAMISRGFGNCHVTSTLTREVWRVQYFNSMNTLILDTLEVVDVPEVAIASADDLADSRTRLDELVQWMRESAAEQAGR